MHAQECIREKKCSKRTHDDMRRNGLQLTREVHKSD